MSFCDYLIIELIKTIVLICVLSLVALITYKLAIRENVYSSCYEYSLKNLIKFDERTKGLFEEMISQVNRNNPLSLAELYRKFDRLFEEGFWSIHIQEIRVIPDKIKQLYENIGTAYNNYVKNPTEIKKQEFHKAFEEYNDAFKSILKINRLK